MKNFIFLLFVFTCLQSFARTSNDSTSYKIIISSIEDYNYFKAKDIYDERKNELSPFHQILVEAYLNNYFNKPQLSEEKFHLLKEKYKKQFDQLPNTTKGKIYELEEFNNIKLYNYKEAANISLLKLTHPSYFEDSSDSSDEKNTYILLSAIKDVPKQTVNIHDNDSINLIKDSIGLINLKVSNGRDSMNFIFDTGAELSSVSESTAKKFGMNILNDSIDVGSSTGQNVKAKIAICNTLKVGNVDVHNVIFFVFKDKDLSFPQIHYQMNGILGFPVLEAFKEIQITQNGKFIVSKQESEWSGKSNLALNTLRPYISIGGNTYLLDTGADATYLYKKYYDENKNYIEKNYKDTTFETGGAGGVDKFNGYAINFSPILSGRKLNLKDVNVFTTTAANNDEESKKLYGRIGQDVIRSFSKMTINFDKMFIKFE